MDLVITLGHAVDLFDPVVIRASMGAIFHSKVCHEQSVKTFERWLDMLKKQCAGLMVVGTDSKAEVSLLRRKCNQAGRPSDR